MTGTAQIDAYAKVNLCLFLGGVRPADGRHELVTVFQSLTLADRVAFRFGAARDEVVCPGVDGLNLAARALDALRGAGWSAPPVHVTIDKRIPVAAGMAGGSSDAAAVLALALRREPLPEPVVRGLAAGLGADVPAMLEPGATLGLGAGEKVQRLAPLAPHAYVVLPSAAQLPTAAVFAEADRLGLARTAAGLGGALTAVRDALGPGARMPDALVVNDLQPAALSLCPSIGAALDAVARAGADHAIVSGSGPTAVGIRWGEDAGAWARMATGALGRAFPGAVAAQPVLRGFRHNG